MSHRAEYKPAKFHFNETQLRKIASGHGVRVAHHQIGKGPHTLMLHPMQHHKLSMNHSKGKGMDLMITPGEMQSTVESGIEGTGIWDTIKDGLSSVWKYVKPVLSGVGDAIAYTNPELAPLREGVRGITGVGLHKHHKHHKHRSHSEEREMHHEAPKKHHRKRVSKHGNGLYL